MVVPTFILSPAGGGGIESVSGDNNAFVYEKLEWDPLTLV